MRYYSTQRPITPGAYPKENVISIKNFHDKKYVSEIGGDVWGYVEYDCELPEEKVRAYEFTPVNPMHCTAKQLAAMKRILSRGQKAMNAAHVSGSSFLVSGQQFCEHGYAITDGGVTAFLPAYAPGIPYATKYEADAVYRVFLDEVGNGDYFSVDLDDVRYDTPDLSYIKEQIAKHKEEGKNSRTLAYNPRCEVMFKAVRLDGSEIVGVFDAQLVRDALECVGKHPVCYLGFNRNKSRPFPFLMVGSDDTLWDFSSGVHALVMPLAKHRI